MRAIKEKERKKKYYPEELLLEMWWCNWELNWRFFYPSRMMSYITILHILLYTQHIVIYAEKILTFCHFLLPLKRQRALENLKFGWSMSWRFWSIKNRVEERINYQFITFKRDAFKKLSRVCHIFMKYLKILYNFFSNLGEASRSNKSWL